jgi:type IV pilus assembly protein PilW
MNNTPTSPKNRLSSYTAKNPQAGFSLIELMVAGTISLLMMAAILQLLLDFSRTNDEMANSNVQMENGRFSLQIIGHDLSHAGFWNDYLPSAAPVMTVPKVCDPFDNLDDEGKEKLLKIPVQSFQSMPEDCKGVFGVNKEDSDVLVVRYVSTCAVGGAGCAPLDSRRIYFQASSCEGEKPYVFALGAASFGLKKRDCLALAERRRYVINVYFVRDDSTLMQAQLAGGGADDWQIQPLVDGVESLIVELGRQENSAGNVSVSFDRCPIGGCDAGALSDVIAAKVYVLVRNAKVSPGYVDVKKYQLGGVSIEPGGGFKRHVYSTSVRLHNLANRRGAP